MGNCKTAGERTRTVNIQPGRLTLYPHSSAETGVLEGSADTPRSSHGSSNAEQPQDGDLDRLIEAWPGLPNPIRSAILAMLPDTGERYLSTFLFEGITEESDDV